MGGAEWLTNTTGTTGILAMRHWKLFEAVQHRSKKFHDAVLPLTAGSQAPFSNGFTLLSVN